MANQSTSRLHGDDYQHLYSWHKILDLLSPSTEIERIWIEHPSVEGVDDVTIYPKDLSEHPLRFYQIKAHMDLSKTYSMEGLITTSKQEGKSLLQSLWNGWSELQQDKEGAVEIWLVSDRHPDGFLGNLIQRRSYGLKEEFFEKISNYRTKVGKKCKTWKEHLKADDQTFADFCRSLRFHFAVDLLNLEKLVDAEMRSYGLKAGDEYRDIAISLVRYWIKTDKREITQPKLTSAIYRKNLWVSSENASIYGITLNSWRTYLTKLSEYYRDWHMPDELRILVTWDVKPVPIDDYIRLKPPSNQPYFSRLIERTDNADVPTKTLLQVIDDKAILIVGDAGAGKSTCLKYLCYHFATEAARKLEYALAFDDLKIPVLVILRKYGPTTNLAELIKAQLRYHGLLVDQAQLNQILERFNFIFLLDGLDEVKTERCNDLISELIVLHENYPEHTIVITTRKQPEPPDVKDFVNFEIQQLLYYAEKSAFARCYLGRDQEDVFFQHIEERKMWDFIEVPLLLVLCLVIFRYRAVTFNSLADIYMTIVELYKEQWENKKIPKPVDRPIPWDILEDSLSILAYWMIVNGVIHSISRKNAQSILQAAIDDFKNKNRWSDKHTVYDLTDQLLTHNLLESFGNRISFWHASFRDFFAALFITKLPNEEIIEHVRNEDLSSVTAFLDGLLPNSQFIREVLVNISLKSETFEEAYWPIEILSSMGSNTTKHILRAASKPRCKIWHGHYYSLEDFLFERDFEGKTILVDVTRIKFHIEYDGEVILYDYEIPADKIDLNFFYALYEKVVLALSEGNIGSAELYQQQIDRYFDELELD